MSASAGVRCPMCARRTTSRRGAVRRRGRRLRAGQVLARRGHRVERRQERHVHRNLYLADKRNYGALLVEAGLARLVQPAADRSPAGPELAEAERKAKSQSLKIWEGYSEAEEAASRAQAELIALEEAGPTPDEKKQVVELSLTEIVDGGKFRARRRRWPT